MEIRMNITATHLTIADHPCHANCHIIWSVHCICIGMRPLTKPNGRKWNMISFWLILELHKWVSLLFVRKHIDIYVYSILWRGWDSCINTVFVPKICYALIALEIIKFWWKPNSMVHTISTNRHTHTQSSARIKFANLNANAMFRIILVIRLWPVNVCVMLPKKILLFFLLFLTTNIHIRIRHTLTHHTCTHNTMTQIYVYT